MQSQTAVGLNKIFIHTDMPSALRVVSLLFREKKIKIHSAIFKPF